MLVLTSNHYVSFSFFTSFWSHQIWHAVSQKRSFQPSEYGWSRERGGGKGKGWIFKRSGKHRIMKSKSFTGLSPGLFFLLQSGQEPVNVLLPTSTCLPAFEASVTLRFQLGQGRLDFPSFWDQTFPQFSFSLSFSFVLLVTQSRFISSVILWFQSAASIVAVVVWPGMAFPVGSYHLRLMSAPSPSILSSNRSKTHNSSRIKIEINCSLSNRSNNWRHKAFESLYIDRSLLICPILQDGFSPLSFEV